MKADTRSEHSEESPQDLGDPWLRFALRPFLLVAGMVTAACHLGTAEAWPKGGPPVISAPRGDEDVCASVYRPGRQAGRHADEPIRLEAGPHLFIDDFLIAESSGVTRRVNRPERDPRLSNPIITSKDDGVWQPYMTVVRDPQSGRFRIWYGAATPARSLTACHLATMESDDGIRWSRPSRVLADPSPMRVVDSVVDEGQRCADPAKRYKLAFFNGGLNIAVSPDGLHWTTLFPKPVLQHNHDIENLYRDTARKQYVATFSVFTKGRTWKGERRATMHSTSRDLLHWEKPWYVLTPDDRFDQGQTQFYGMSGYLLRGGLWIGLVKVLRDDLVAAGTPRASYGIGYTTLAWTRDGRHWTRDGAAYFEPDPQPGVWDHAHAWLDCQLPVGDRVFIYYGGYKNGHKVNRFEERQIGLVHILRDRYVSRDAGSSEGVLLTPPVFLAARGMTLNAKVEGRLQVRLLDLNGEPLQGFATDRRHPIHGDGLAHAVHFARSLAAVGDKPVQIEFRFQDAQLYGFELTP